MKQKIPNIKDCDIGRIIKRDFPNSNANVARKRGATVQLARIEKNKMENKVIYPIHHTAKHAHIYELCDSVGQDSG